jgi:DNA-binding transcriptional LysR family regulator
VAPTQAGRALLTHARAILQQTERLREDLGAFAGASAGQIRVLSNTNALAEFLPETLSAFLAGHPQVSVELEERLSDEIVGLIAEGVADIGIVAGHTVFVWPVLNYKAALPHRDDLVALRLRTVVTKDQPCSAFPLRAADKDDPAVILDLDYWVLLPR